MPEQTDVMIALGAYRFALRTAAYQILRRRAEQRWPSQERLGRAPALQYVGPGVETITLEGVIYPGFRGGLGQIAALRAEAGKGEALILVDGLGNVWGKWCVLSVEETQSILFADGAFERQDFTLELQAYGEDAAS